jgi:hypothetical protein
MKKSLLILFLSTLFLSLCILLPYSINIFHGVPNTVDPIFYAWNLSYNADSLFKGFNTAVNTNIFYPLTNTLAYSDTLWMESIFASPVIWITHNPVLAENISIIMTFPLSALAMFFLSFYLTKNIAASSLSGIFYAFSYPRLSQVGHLPTLSDQWLPLYILFLLKFLKEGKSRNFIMMCATYLLSIGSSIYFGVFLIPITACVLFIDILKRIRTHTMGEYKNRILRLLPLLVPFLIILGVLLLPYIRLKIENPEIKRSIDDMTHLRANIVDYISVLPTSINPFKLLPVNTNEHVLFPTLTLLVLSCVGLITSFKRNRYLTSVFICTALAAFVLSLGNEQAFSIGSISTGTLKMPYYYIYKYFPIFQIVRVPARFGIFVILALSALSAWGMDFITKMKISPRVGKLQWLLCLPFFLFLLEVWQLKTPFVSVPSETQVPKVYEWIRIQPEPMIIAEVPIALFYHGNPMEEQLYIPYRNLKENDIYAMETYRIYFSTFHKKRMANGYTGFLPESYNTLAEKLENFPSDYSIQALQEIGVTHAIVHIWQYDDKKKADIIKALNTSNLLTLSYSDDDDYVYSVQKRKR